MKRLVILALAALSLAAGHARAQDTVFVQKEAGAPYAKEGSPYLGYVQLGQAVAERLVQGVDYSGRIYIDPATFPNNAVISWNLPFRPTVSGAPWGYLHLSRGRPSGGLPKVIDPAKPLSDLKALTVSIDAVMSPVGDASVLSDTFLYKDAELSEIVLELGVFPYAGQAARRFVLQSPPIGKGVYKDGHGRRWIARRAGLYCMFILAKGDALKGDIDLKGFLDFLMKEGVAKPQMIYPGTALGVEPGYGAGMLRLYRFAVTEERPFRPRRSTAPVRSRTVAQ